MNTPTSTYRLQFTPDFGFQDALALLPYLRDLGIGAIYASPIARSRKGSRHGYDVCDPTQVDPELGTLEEFEALLLETGRMEMQWIQDIVPNHMAYSHENPYLADVLEHGRASRYADWFDITWEHQHPSLRGRLLAPFLGKPYGQCLLDGELRLVWEQDSLWLAYWEQRYPICPESYATVLLEEREGLPPLPDPENEASLTFREALLVLQELSSLDSPERRSDRCALGRRTLRELLDREEFLREHIENRLRSIADRGAAPFLDEILCRQHFRPAFWRITAEELNYRRFFTVSDLICLQVDLEHVFEATHAFILGYIERGLVHGLRIDHIDGLRDPAEYLQRLRDKAPGAWIGVEKILEHDERLPGDWPVDGTTGYEALNHLDAVLVDEHKVRSFDALYRRFAPDLDDPAALQLEKKRLIIGKHMAGDIDNVAHLVIRVAGSDLLGRDLTLTGMRRALVEVLANFPVYRTYVTERSFTRDDARRIAHALALSRKRMPGREMEFHFIERFLMMRGEDVLESQYDQTWKDAVMRFQQYTGPLMAKGCEDTFFYVFNRHTALNEVGGWPMRFGASDKEFHRFLKDRATNQSRGLTATATHDTKRGEDTRARLHVLTEIPAEWSKAVLSWRRQNAVHHPRGRAATRLDPNDEFLLYQSLVGTFPFEGALDDTYRQRIRDYMVKAVREAKVHTAWIKPDEAYESALLSFIEAILDPSRSGEFLASLQVFVARIAPHGVWNTLARTILKCAIPGVPDFYQGCEAWDFTLVDPDNRRAVDYELLWQGLAHDPLPADLLELPFDPRLKQSTIRRCLWARRFAPDLIQSREILPLEAKGARKRNVMAFARRSGDRWMLAAVPRFTTHLASSGAPPVGEASWGNTRLILPPELRDRTLHDALSGSDILLAHELPLPVLFERFPGAFLNG